MIVDIYNPYPNQEVTSDYVSIISAAAVKLGHKINNCTRMVDCKREKAIIVLSSTDAIKARLKGYKRIMLWMQGISPEESYMRHHSWIRFYILSAIEKMALKLSDMVFMVSDEMHIHYKRKYGIVPKNLFIMPCLNEEMDKTQFDRHDYKKNTFVYAGALSKWQCFEETVDLYKKIENRYGDAVSLRILTKDMGSAKRIIKDKRVLNYSLGFVPKEKVREEMVNAKYGFCIREDTAVNNVATPTKLSSYVCNGVIPIFTSAIKDFSNIAKNSIFALNVDSDDFWKRLDDMVMNDVSSDEIYDDFNKSFGRYYSKSGYREEIASLLKTVLEE